MKMHSKFFLMGIVLSMSLGVCAQDPFKELFHAIMGTSSQEDTFFPGAAAQKQSAVPESDAERAARRAKAERCWAALSPGAQKFFFRLVTDPYAYEAKAKL